ncbi:MAG: hypothetical protein HC879_13125 [Leptolyngbyaceae cyanobacterium SL_5_9]|nr:hypothetical protein [Leptolyngbyaceae cyanobacterium SL_5_9]NJO74218.1 hypothetical protein [Leptolyngbyaceae cyanobacterium RM1_406_9]
MKKDQIHNQTADSVAEHLILPAENQGKSDFARLLQALFGHPFLLWGGLWAILLITINISLNGFLLNPEFVAQSEQIQEPPVVESPDTPTPVSVEGKDSLPLWSFGAIALSCAVATLMVSQRLRQIPGPRKPAKRSRVNPRSLPAAQIGASGKAIAPGSKSAAAPNQFTNVLQSTEETPVSVVPTEETHSLYWDETSLADIDIRYRRPLSS